MIDVDSLKRRVSLAAVIRGYGVELKKQGSKLFAHCPFHDDSKPSFSLYDHHGTERAGCKGCDWDGDAIQFVQAMEACDFATAAARLEEFAGGLAPDFSTSKNQKISEPKKQKRETKLGKVIATHDYHDPEGVLNFQVVRRETLDKNTGEVIDRKHFSQRRPDGQGGWIWNLNGVVRQLYRLQAVAAAETVWIVEGEKDVHSVEACGVVATTNAGGAKAKWEPQYTESLRGKHVIICGDSDQPGRERDATIAVHLAGAAASVRMVKLPEGLIKDVTDWLEAGQSIQALLEMATEFVLPAEPEPVPPPEPPPPPRSTARVAEPEGDWRELLLYNHMRNPKPSIANVEIALRGAAEWRGVLAYSDFSGRVYARKPFPGFPELRGTVEWTDVHDVALTVWLHHQGIMVGTDVAGKAVQRVAWEHRFHPVREYLEALEWDAQPRLDNWLIEYCQTSASNYAAAVGRAWMISAVARIFKPGCKADCCLILEGEQGTGKSTTLSILGGEWFTDELAELGSKDSSVQVQGAWIVEIGELSGMRRSEVEHVKSFMSRPRDRFRPPYGRYAVEFPRQCVFAGSTNKETYLPDETGNRRFWPVRCGEGMLVDELARDRDQLWAEAMYHYRGGSVWWLKDEQIVRDAQEEQAKRYESDPWQQHIADWLDSRDDVSITAILEHCIAKPTGQWTQQDRQRIGKCLRTLRWVSYQAATGERRFRRSFGARQSEFFG